MKKRILSILLCCVMLIGLLPATAFAADEATHTHCICGGNVTAGDHTSHTNVAYQPWNGTDSITYMNGVAYVYLTGNATISKNLEITGGNRLYLCLNGKTLASNGTNKITVKENSRLTISDCAGGGTIKGATSGWGGMCIYIYKSTADLFGGKLTGGKVTGKGGGGAVALDDAACVLNIYGGEIAGNNGNQRGGGIYMLNGTLNIYGGTISGNKSSSNGGAVYVTKGTVNMSGGTISGNTAGKDIYTGYGGAVCIGSGTMNMSGGEIVDNHAYRAGGIYGGPNGGVTITISGGRITENTASETVKNYGAGVMNNRGTTTLRGNPYIRGNYAVLNGTVNNGYANLYYENGKNRLRVENLTEGADIGITIGRSLAPTEGTPLVFSEVCDKNYSGYFTSDEGYDVGYNAETKQLELRVPCKHSKGTIQWTTTPTTHEQAWSCCGLVTIPETAHTWENGKCTVCEYVCLHDGGTATCTKKAVCDICGSEYGDLAPHNFTVEKAEEPYLKSAATCTDKAVYYKSCSVCGLTSKEETGEATFESGEVDANNHAGTLGDWQNNAEKHWKEYSCCHAKAEEADHVYDNDADATCNICGYPRTITPSHTHSWSTEWTSDSTHHWHECTADGCDVTENSGKDSYGTHVYDDETDMECNICGYSRSKPEVTFNSITVIGNSEEDSNGNWLHNVADWSINDSNHMTETSKNVYEITYTGIAPGSYQFKFAANDAWTDSWGAGAGLTGAAVYNGNNIEFSVDTDNSTVKLVLDLSGYDPDTKQGATYSITVTPPHTHSWATEWSSNSTHHWHECTAGGCNVTENSGKGDYGTHVYDDETDMECNTCGYRRTILVTFDPNGGSVHPASMTTGADGKLASLPAPTRSSYSFDGWYTEKSGGTKVTTETVFKTETTVYAHWTYTGGSGGDSGCTYYTLTFKTNGGSTITSERFRSGTMVDLTKYTPTRKGCTFTGWYSDKGLTSKITSIRLDGNKTVYAGWQKQTAENPFTDVSKSDWFYDGVMFAYETGLMVGTSDTLFSPYGTATRAMMATVLWRMEGSPAPKNAPGFTDVASGKWYSDAIAWTTENGIYQGYGSGKFGPDDPITREQLAAIFYRYADYKGYDMSIKGSLDNFKDKVSAWAQDAMQWAVGSGLIQGKTGSVLDPQGTATRAEIAAMLHRFIEKYGIVEGKAPAA